MARSILPERSRWLAMLLSGWLAAGGGFPAGAQGAPTSLKIVILEGDGAINNIRQRTAREPIVQVQDVDGARAAVAAAPDAVIAQGNEAGGHTGRRGTLAFAAQVLDLAGGVPVLVAGGIGSGRGVAAALAMGAAGAVLGTRFKASEEFEGRPELKQALVASNGSDTLHDEIFDDATHAIDRNGKAESH